MECDSSRGIRYPAGVHSVWVNKRFLYLDGSRLSEDEQAALEEVLLGIDGVRRVVFVKVLEIFSGMSVG